MLWELLLDSSAVLGAFMFVGLVAFVFALFKGWITIDKVEW